MLSQRLCASHPIAPPSFEAWSRFLHHRTIGHKTQTSIWSAWLKEKLQETHLLANYRSSGKFSFIQLLQADRTVRLSEKGKASFLPEFTPCWQQQDRFSYLTPSISEVAIEWTFKWDSLYSNHHFFTVIPLYPIYISIGSWHRTAKHFHLASPWNNVCCRCEHSTRLWFELRNAWFVPPSDRPFTTTEGLLTQASFNS